MSPVVHGSLGLAAKSGQRRQAELATDLADDLLPEHSLRRLLIKGFKTLKTAYATIKGFEDMRALRNGQAAIFNLTGDVRGEARIVERAFGIGPSALTEAVALLAPNLEGQTA
jgi:hypothetical protein